VSDAPLPRAPDGEAPAEPRRRRHRKSRGKRRHRTAPRVSVVKWWHVLLAVAIGLAGVMTAISLLQHRPPVDQ
jgi:hypothetical protein